MSKTCPFCFPDHERILIDDGLCFVMHDRFPVSPGHLLILPRRHIASFFDATATERASFLALLDQAKSLVEKKHHPAGYNIGINDGETAGQTVPHLHIHLVPRYLGDSDDPRGGVRWVLPEKAKYWS